MGMIFHEGFKNVLDSLYEDNTPQNLTHQLERHNLGVNDTFELHFHNVFYNITCTLLVFELRLGNYEIIQTLLECGADPRILDGITFAVESNLYDVLELFIEYGFDLDTPDRHGYTAIDIAISNRNHSKIERLMDIGATKFHDKRFHSVDDGYCKHAEIHGLIIKGRISECRRAILALRCLKQVFNKDILGLIIQEMWKGRRGEAWN